jgi:hypothetical protein
MLKPVSLNLVSTCSVVQSGVNTRQTTSEFLGVLPRQTSACIFSSPYSGGHGGFNIEGVKRNIEEVISPKKFNFMQTLTH